MKNDYVIREHTHKKIHLFLGHTQVSVELARPDAPLSTSPGRAPEEGCPGGGAMTLRSRRGLLSSLPRLRPPRRWLYISKGALRLLTGPVRRWVAEFHTAPAGLGAGLPSPHSCEQLSPPLELRWLGDRGRRRWVSPGSRISAVSSHWSSPRRVHPWGSPALGLWARCLWDTS